MVRRTIETAAKNLSDAIPRISASYKAGVATADWATPAGSEAAETNYSAGVQAAIAKKSRQTGVRATSNETWRKQASELGSTRIGPGLTLGLPSYRSNFAPILSAMNSAAEAAPPKTLDPMANIDTRLKPIVNAARAAAGKI